MRRTTITALATILLTATATDAAPLPKEPPQNIVSGKSRRFPDLAALGRTNYGEFIQIGRDVSLVGNGYWTATGTIREDGSLLLVWYAGSSSRPCYVGVYRFDGKHLVGRYATPENASMEADGSLADGSLSGTNSPDRITPILIDP